MMLTDTLMLAGFLALAGYAGGISVAYWDVRRRLRNLQATHQSMLLWGRMTHERLQAEIADMQHEKSKERE